jgi:hypothetical protein
LERVTRKRHGVEHTGGGGENCPPAFAAAVTRAEHIRRLRDRKLRIGRSSGILMDVAGYSLVYIFDKSRNGNALSLRIIAEAITIVKAMLV